MATRKIQLLPAQLELVENTTSTHIALVAGLGAGKTRGLVWKAIAVATANGVNQPTLFIGLTYRMLEDVVLPFFREIFAEHKMAYTYRKKESQIEFAGGRIIWLRSGDKPDSIQGLNAACVLIDECALQKKRLVDLAVLRFGRVKAPVMQIILGGTPEGFNHFYEACSGTGDWADVQVRTIRARTIDNIFLPEGYTSQFAHLSDDDKKQYLGGEFILKGGRVYQFDKKAVFQPCHDPIHGDQLLLCDFNRARMAWAHGRLLNDVIHIWGESIGDNVTTREHGEAVQRIYADDGILTSEVTVYCDATGGYQRTFTTQTDVGILRQIGYNVKRKNRNPPIESRVNAMNEALRTGKLLIDKNRAPYMADCLMRQSRDRNGHPGKTGGWDHGNDAMGYGVEFLFPVTGPRAVAGKYQ